MPFIIRCAGHSRLFFQSRDSHILWFWEMFLDMNLKIISSPFFFYSVNLFLSFLGQYSRCLIAFPLSFSCLFYLFYFMKCVNFYLPILVLYFFVWTNNFPCFLIVSPLLLPIQHPILYLQCLFLSLSFYSFWLIHYS